MSMKIIQLHKLRLPFSLNCFRLDESSSELESQAEKSTRMWNWRSQTNCIPRLASE